MMKIGSSHNLVLTTAKGGKPATFRDPETDKVLILRGYGTMKGKLHLRKGIDLTKPIFEQWLKLEAQKKQTTAAKGKKRKA